MTLHTPDCDPPDPAPRRASFRPPPLSCDAHAHIIGDPAVYPMVERRSYTPPLADVTSYRHMLETLGLQRAVIVQPSFYGTDNRCTRDAIRQSAGAWRGVAVIGPDTDAAGVAALDADGFCGARVNLLFAGGVGIDALEPVARRVAAHGWHIQLLMDIADLPAIEARVDALPCDVVFDHLGHSAASTGVDTPGARSLLRLVERRRAWVKLSGGYRLSKLPPPYPDLLPLATRLVAAAADRLLWGSDWPHTAIHGAMPNDGALLDTLGDWVPEVALRHRILADNPTALYGFDARSDG